MGKDNLREKPGSKSAVQAAMRRMYVHMIVLTLISVAVIIGVYYLLQGRQSGQQPPGPLAVKDGPGTPEVRPGFEILKGRWVRPDGGYIIEIKQVDSSGKMTAAYFNPRPINVSQAEASLDGTTIKVFMELRDVNYPGATYNLTYEPGEDQLRGVYYQPALQQSFEIFFVRER